jgi:hypothetical protein
MATVSKHTRTAFREFLVGWTLREISDVFDAADVPRGEPIAIGGQRRSLVEAYYAGVDWDSPRDLRRVVRVFEEVLSGLDRRIEEDPDRVHESTEVVRREYLKLANSLRRDGYAFENGRLVSAASIDLSHLESASTAIDRETLREHIRRIEQSIDSDPGQAVGSAKELVETASKGVLRAYGEDPDKEDSLQKLVGAARNRLGLSTDAIPDSAKGAAAIKQVLSGLAQIVGGTAELRNLYGTGHGRTRVGGLTARHARLVVGAASTLSRFLLDTLEEKRRLGQLPDNFNK